MEETRKYIDVVVKLNRLTKEDKLSWEKYDYEGGFPFPSNRYRTRYKDKYFVINAFPQPPRVIKKLFKGTPRHVNPSLDSPINRPTLTIEDDEENTIFSFPRTSVIDDLLDSIRYKMDEADTFLDEFLKEEL